MYIGHFAVGLAAKKVAPRPSLGTYFMAASFLDLLWPVFLLLGIERVEIDPGNTVFTPLSFVYYPFSHSLLMAAVWALVFSFVYYRIRKDTTVALWLWVAVFSHWILDLITHRADLPLYPGGDTVVGFGLWNSLVGTIFVEGGIFLGGIFIYLRATKPKDTTGTVAFWALIIFLFATYMADIFGPPPPSPKFLAWFSPFAWLLVLWGYWIDRHRSAAIAAQ